MRQQVTAAKAAPPKGVYSPAIIAEGRLVFVSGQTPVDPQTGELMNEIYKRYLTEPYPARTTVQVVLPRKC